MGDESTTTKLPAFLAKLQGAVGTELGCTAWFSVSQRDADVFSTLTDDWDYMHNDPSWAGPRLGGTIAHGLYVLSLLPHFLKEVSPDAPIVAADGVTVLNYGFDRVRFTSPLRIGARARDRVRLIDMTEKNSGDYLVRYRHVIEKESDGTSTLVADSLLYYVVGYDDKWHGSGGSA